MAEMGNEIYFSIYLIQSEIFRDAREEQENKKEK